MNCRKICCILLILIGCLLRQSSFSQASGNEEHLFQQGNEAYSHGDYGQAIAHFEELVAVAGLSPAVLYNLANSYAQAGKIGRAVLNFERALRLAPTDSDIIGNLELVRKESGLFSGETEGVERLFHLFTLNGWAMFGLFVLVAFTLLQIVAARYPLGRKTTIGARIACCLLFLLALIGTTVRYQYFKPSVVITNEARLLISPFPSAASVGAIQEGRLVYPEKKHGSFTYVRDETNRKGWMVSADIEAVCAEAGPH
jgi:hypothetical protein